MVLQLVIGSLLFLATSVLSALAWALHERLLGRLEPWLAYPPHVPKTLALLVLSLGVSIVMLTASVWIWAFAFHALGTFESFETSMYFALVAFTTLGFGDLLLPDEWRLLGGFAAANGLLLFGLLTAVLVETVRETRARQKARRR